MPSFLRIASASRSGSPGMRGPLVPGAGLVLRKTRIHSSICFEFVFVDEAVDLHGDLVHRLDHTLLLFGRSHTEITLRDCLGVIRMLAY